MSPKKSKNIPIDLYSSIKFAPDSVADSKNILGWKSDNTLKLLIKFVSKYGNDYFRSIVSLDVKNVNGNIVKKNIYVRDICFKNELNVSASSQTKEYEYLYEISCSSADNHESSSSSSSSSFSSSDLSLDSIINKKIEKDIAVNVKNFIDSDAFEITWTEGITTITLDTSQFKSSSTDQVIFESVKNVIKYKFHDDSSSCSSSSSSSCSSSCSSSSSSYKPNKLFKILMITAVIAFVVMLIMNLIKKNGYGTEYNTLYKLQDGLTNGVTGLIDSVKGLIYKPSDSQGYSNDYSNVNPDINDNTKDKDNV